MIDNEKNMISEAELDGVSGGLIFNARNIIGSDPNNPFEVLDDRTGDVLARANTYDLAVQYAVNMGKSYEYTEDWQEITERYNTGLTFEQLTDRVLAIYLARKGFRTNMNISAQIQSIAYWDETQDERERLKTQLEDGSLILDPDTIYIIPEIIRYHYWSFGSSEELSEYLERVRSAYEGRADLRFLSMDLNDAINNYWILCPR